MSKKMAEVAKSDNKAPRAAFDYDVKANKCRTSFSVRKEKGGREYTKACTFDFANVAETELVGLALYGLRVRVQAQLRERSEAERTLSR